MLHALSRALAGAALAFAFLLPLFLPAQALAQGYSPGLSGRTTYIYSVSALSCVGNSNVSIESTATVGFKIAQICYTMSGATASAIASYNLQRESSASSGGGLATSDRTSLGSPGSVTRLDLTQPAYAGIVRTNGSGGTSAGIIEQWDEIVPTLALAAGLSGCRDYGLNGEKMPTAPPGVSNGLLLTTGAGGTGALASCGIAIKFIAE